MTAVGVLGEEAGARRWPTSSLAKASPVRLWAYEAEVVESINRQQENTLFLPGCRLAQGAASVRGSGGDGAGSRCHTLGLAQSCRAEVVARVVGSVLEGTLVVSATKGLGTRFVAADVGSSGADASGARIVALSGPSFALEVFQEQPTAVVAAARSGERLKTRRRCLRRRASGSTRTRTSPESSWQERSRM